MRVFIGRVHQKLFISSHVINTSTLCRPVLESGSPLWFEAFLNPAWPSSFCPVGFRQFPCETLCPKHRYLPLASLAIVWLYRVKAISQSHPSHYQTLKPPPISQVAAGSSIVTAEVYVMERMFICSGDIDEVISMNRFHITLCVLWRNIWLETEILLKYPPATPGAPGYWLLPRRLIPWQMIAAGLRDCEETERWILKFENMRKHVKSLGLLHLQRTNRFS